MINALDLNGREERKRTSGSDSIFFFFFVESFFTVNIHSETAEEPFEHRKGGAAS